ncbi:histidine phosphatase family protein [Tropicimonas aquimaris]|uniref:Histidine phosphatase family protein n=1 Tax=Tropicimonas aquimaris TaxID=914152 RepID=A0ABW3IX22_9RHOB
MKYIVIALCAFASMASADDWDALTEPGSIAVMRHALAPGTGDPAAFTLGDCATQRNLDERGREQARMIGEALRERGITFDRVLTSQWCRTRETAALLDVGPVSDAPVLNSFFEDFSTRERQTREALDLIAQSDGHILLVSHQVNISALTGRGTRSGEILAIQLTDDGVEVTGSVLIDP